MPATLPAAGHNGRMTTPAPMTEPAGPRYTPGSPAASTDVTVPKRTPFTLAHLRALVAQADQIGLAPDALVTYTATMRGTLSGLKVTGGTRPAANTSLTPQ